MAQNKLAVIGCGGIVRSAYLPSLAFLRVGNVSVFDAAGPEITALAVQAAGRLGLSVRAASSIPEAVAGADRVLVAVPPLNAPRAVVDVCDAVAAGTRILVEKPAGISASAARQMLTAAQRADVAIEYMETFVHSLPADVMFGEMRSGRLGELQGVSMHFSGNSPAALETAWRGERASGGEVIHDWGIHSLGLLFHLARAASLPTPASEDFHVDSATLRRHGARDVLTEADARGVVGEVPVSMALAWHTFREPALVLDYGIRRLEMSVRTVDGHSSWHIEEIGDSGVVYAVDSLYEKEVFARGIRRFLQRDDRADRSSLDFSAAVASLRIADHLYDTSFRAATTSA